MSLVQSIISWLQSTRICGRPRYAAEWVRDGVYLLRWLAIVGTLAWLNNYYIFLAVERESFAWGYPWLVVGATTAAVTAAGAFVFLVPRSMTLVQARQVIFLTLLAMTFAAAVIVGLTRVDPTFTPILNLTLLGGLAAAPLRLTPQITLAVLGVLAALAVAATTGWPLEASEAFRLSPTVTYASIGIVANRWRFGTFRAHRYSELLRARQKQRFERLLERTLSAPVVRRLEQRGAFPPALNDVTVIVCDIRGFSAACRRMPAELVVAELKRFYRIFDACCVRHSVEPLRSQGDCRVAAAGLWEEERVTQHRPAIDALLAMLDLQRLLPPVTTEGEIRAESDRIEDIPLDGRLLWPARIGIHCGPVMAGVMEGERLTFDIWGETVNIAARLQQAADANQVMASEAVLWAARGLFAHGPIHSVKVKDTTIGGAAEVLGIRQPYCDVDGLPGPAFWQRYRQLDLPPIPPGPDGTATQVIPASERNGADAEAPHIDRN